MKNIKKTIFGIIAGLGLVSTGFAEAELDGYCPVCYIAAGEAVMGVEKFQSEHEGKTYYFVKEEAKAAFDKAPEEFLPAYGGLCAYGVSLGKKFEGDPKQFSVVDGKIYLSSNADIKKKFDADAKAIVKIAEEKWEMVSKEAAEPKESM